MRFDKYRNINYILDFTGKDYYICENGDLYWKNRKLKTEVNRYGYITNELKDVNGKSYSILRHQLVAQYFLIDDFKEGLTVDHINNNKADNNVNNLRWTDYKTQIKNQVRNKTNTKVYNPMHSNKQKFTKLIPSQKEYFIKYGIPKFDKQNYSLLYKIYLIYDIMNGKQSDDSILNKYAEECKAKNFSTREEIYDFLFEKVKNYKQDNSLLIIKRKNLEINISKFEDLFLDKHYKKKELKNSCMKLFAIEEEIFKNEKTIKQFLNKLGYILKYADKEKALRKIQKNS